jgi:type II secretory pathway component PulF
MGVRYTRFRFNGKERSAFYEDMNAFVTSGLPPFQIIERMVMVYRSRRRLRWKVDMLRSVAARIGEGRSLASAMKAYVPAEEAAMLEAGETTGALQDALAQLTYLTKKRVEVSGSLKKNLLPAAGFLVVGVVIMVFMLNTVLKEAGRLITPEIMSQLMLAPVYFGGGRFIVSNLVMIIPVVLAAIIAIAISLPKWRPGPARIWLDNHVPPYTVFKRMQAAFFMMTVSSMMSAGIPFQQAVSDIQKTSTPWARQQLRKIMAKQAAGRPPIESMQKSILPEDVEDRMSIYALLPEFDVVMESVAKDSLDILLKRVNAMGTALNVAVMLYMAGFLILTIFSIGEVALAIDPRNLSVEQ